MSRTVLDLAACAIALFWLVLESPAEVAPPPDQSTGSHGFWSVEGGSWPWTVPALDTASDFVVAAVAARALTAWCDDVAERVGELRDLEPPQTPRNLQLQAWEVYIGHSCAWSGKLRDMFLMAAMGDWNRPVALRIAREWVAHLRGFFG